MNPFDPTLTELPARTVALDCVIDVLAPTPHTPERIEAYRAAMARGDRFPPIAVIRLGGRFVVTDGHKRLAAYQTFRRPDIVVEVWTIRRFLRDQWDQACANARKNRAIAAGLFSDPRESRRLLLATLGHWRRVARSLASRRNTDVDRHRAPEAPSA